MCLAGTGPLCYDGAPACREGMTATSCQIPLHSVSETCQEIQLSSPHFFGSNWNTWPLQSWISGLLTSVLIAICTHLASAAQSVGTRGSELTRSASRSRYFAVKCGIVQPSILTFLIFSCAATLYTTLFVIVFFCFFECPCSWKFKYKHYFIHNQSKLIFTRLN